MQLNSTTVGGEPDWTPIHIVLQPINNAYFDFWLPNGESADNPNVKDQVSFS